MKRVAIITSSDAGYRGEREDLSGPAIKEIVEKAGYEEEKKCVAVLISAIMAVTMTFSGMCRGR